MTALVDDVRVALRAVADPLRAPKMQAYMKSVMPYLGVPVPQVRKIVNARARLERQMTVAHIRDDASTLWRGAQFREERYAATALVAQREAAGALDLLDLYREMIVTGAWWDHVDEVSHRVGRLLVAHRETVRPLILDWSTDSDLWLRRTSIICQFGRRNDIDLDLLEAVIRPNLPDREFFIRKAIGWALRDYGWHDPEWVREFVVRYRLELQPLSVVKSMDVV